MAKFTDTQGTEWSVSLDFGMLKRIKKQLGVDLLKAMDDANALNALAEDVETLVNTIWLCIAEQATEHNITDEVFGGRLDGTVIDAATRALLEALVDFFPPSRRPILKKLIEKAEAIETASLQAIEQKIDAMQTAVTSTTGV